MRVEVLSVSDTGRRRRWATSEKIRIVLESLEAGATATEVARRNEVSRSQIYDWRHRYRSGLFDSCVPSFTRVMPGAVEESSALAPASSVEDVDNLPEVPAPSYPSDAPTFVEPLLIEFGNGARMTVPVSYDPAIAAQLILAMRTGG